MLHNLWTKLSTQGIDIDYKKSFVIIVRMFIVNIQSFNMINICLVAVYTSERLVSTGS
jgi:hypothetical protein